MMGCELRRDGRFLELWDRPTGALVMEAVRSDAGGSVELKRYRGDVPPDVASWFEVEARRLLRSPRP